MKALPLEARKVNVHLSDKRILCGWCGDTGSVTVQTRPAPVVLFRGKRKEPVAGASHDEVGPCPYCVRGYQLEFAGGGDGFWQGRDTDELVPLYQDGEFLPPEENARRMRQLAFGSREMPE